MRIWTYAEVKAKVLQDLSMEEESFIHQDELVGYCNDAIDAAEADILTLHQDYFRRSRFLDLVSGTSAYALPSDIYANKIRGVVYANGTDIYPVDKIRDNENAFLEMAQISQGGANDRYRYDIQNTDSDTDRQFVLYPTSRETSSTVMKLWYIRNANRIPLSTEYVAAESFATGAVSAAGNTIAVTGSYSTGAKIKFTSTVTLPAPLVAGTEYFVIRISATSIKVAETLTDAIAGTAIDLTDTGTGTHTFTQAVSSTIQGATEIDIPEFINFVMMFMKVMCLAKEAGDPRLQLHIAGMESQRKLMVDTLSKMVPDNKDEIQADFSHYDQSN
jgi:hypothetical protein